MAYDVIVIGSGPAGYVATVRLLSHGLKVALIERQYLGGECTNYGCIPSKALIEISHAISAIKSLRKVGIECKLEMKDLSRAMEWVRRVIQRSRDGVRCLVSEADIYEGVGRIKSRNEVVVSRGGSKEVIEAKNIVVATGTDPANVPGIEIDGEHIISNREFFELKDVPSSMVIIGAGAIGSELGMALAKIGVEVHLVEIMDRVLPMCDADVSRVIAKYMRVAGVDINVSSTVKSVEKCGEGVKVRIVSEKGAKEVKVDKVLVAAGRRCNTYGLGLEEVGVKLGHKGTVIVDKYQRTSIPGIYAIGDITGPPLLAHKAFREGLIAADHIAGVEPQLPRSPVPEVIYTDPEVASVGITESKAVTNGVKAVVVKYPFTAVPRDFTKLERTPDGFIKLVVDEASKKLLGAVIVGNGASELIHSLAMAVTLGIKVSDVAKVIYPHPTVSEGIGEAAHLALGEPIHIPVSLSKSLIKKLG